MVNNIYIYIYNIYISTVTFNNRFSHLCVIIDVLADDVWVEEVIKIFVELFIINVWADVVIDTLSGA